MNDDRTLERAARSWLEAGPIEAPDHAVEAALLVIQTTRQERDVRVPWRVRSMSTTARLAVSAVAVAVVAVGGALILRPGSNSSVGTPPASPGPRPSASVLAAVPSPSVQRTAGPPVDASTLQGRILMEHLGNAPDRSEMPTTDYHPERRRLYWMNPATMTGATAAEFLPGQPSTGKLNADVSSDGRQVVFMDTAQPADVWLANTDGTGLRDLSGSCTCSELDPAFDPTGTRIVFVHLEGASRSSLYGANLAVQRVPGAAVKSWLGIRDLASGTVTKVAQTSTSGPDNVPYQPAWSPDGKSIVFQRTSWSTDGTPTGGSLQVVDLASGAVRALTTTPQVPIPGDPAWSPDGSTIAFASYPISTMGSIPNLPGGALYTVRADGTNLRRLLDGGAAPTYLPDGRILFQNNTFWVMNADGSQPLPVNLHGDDLTELEVGFAYVPHWVATP